jgi:hypothetical protein
MTSSRATRRNERAHGVVDVEPMRRRDEYAAYDVVEVGVVVLAYVACVHQVLVLELPW